jgi:hypothetical protein
VSDPIIPKAIIGAAMHKLIHLIYGVLKHRQPFDAHWAQRASNALLPSKSSEIFTLNLDFQDGI